MIPKPNGGERPLGIPAIRDRVVQTAVQLILEPIWEAELEPNAYGHRPRKSAQGAIQKVDELLQQGYTDVVDADLSKYLDTASYCPLVHEMAPKQVGLLIDYFDSQALTPALPNEHGFELAALDTLQHRLPRNAEFDRGSIIADTPAVPAVRCARATHR